MPKQPTRHYDYILGNPPFKGSKLLNAEERKDIEAVFASVTGAGTLDYVAGWYGLAAAYVQAHTATAVGLVSTNSVVQGEQVGIIWGELLKRRGMQIHFAHQTFQWTNEARGVAAVHCIIVGFGQPEEGPKRLFLYEEVKGEPTEITARNINAYLVDGPDVILQSRQKPICDVPLISKGNQPTDGGFLLLNEEEYKRMISEHPEAAPYIKKLIGAIEFIQGIPRYCLWLADISPAELRSMVFLRERLEGVRNMRIKSTDPATRRLAEQPYRFRETRVFEHYIVVPSVSSERRNYIPMGFLDSETIPTNLVLIIPNASLYHFGVLTSKMHMAWTKHVCGRLKSDFRYSKDIVYNNFPWPENPTERNIQAVEAAAQNVLDARAAFPGSSLADLYDPLTMPALLAKAHAALDKAVDICYRPQTFPNEAKRMEFLFDLYDKYTAGIFAEGKKGKKKG